MSPRILTRAITSIAAVSITAATSFTLASPVRAAHPTSPSASAGVTTAPSAPTNVVVTASNPRELTATWQPPAQLNGAAITDYAVTFRTTTAAVPTTLTLLSGGPETREVTATGLTAGMTYEVTVVARSTGGDSVSSAGVSKSAYDAPFFPSGGSYIGGYQIRPEARVWLSWSAANGNGATISSYEVWSSRDTTTPLTTVPGTNNFANLVDLPTGVPMTFTVTAITEHGLRTSIGPSQPVTLVSKPSAPREVTALAGVESATVTWLPPSDTGGEPIDHYVVTMSPGDIQRTVPGDETQASFSLAAGTTYTFSVTAENGSGSSPAVTSNPVTPTAWQPPPATPTPVPVPTPTPTPSPVPAPAPEAPAQPDRPVVKVSGAKAVITWPTPTSGASVTRYKVVLVKPNGKKVSTVVKSRRAVLRNLASGTYKVSVTAGNATGWSTSSRLAKFTVG